MPTPDSVPADKPKTPKPPDKPPVPPDAQKSQPGAGRPPDKAAQPDGKGAKDNHAPAGPQGGKPADVPAKQGDTGPHQSGDKTGTPGQDAGQRRSGDGPVKIVEGPRNADGPHQAGDRHPGWQMSARTGDWSAQLQSLWQQRPEGPKPIGVPDVKQQGDRHPERFTNTLDLNGCRTKDGKNLDPAKVKAELVRAVKTDISMSLQGHLRTDIGGKPQRDAAGYPHGGHTGREVHTRPIEVRIKIEHAKSGVEVRQVQDMFVQVCKEYKVTPVFDAPKRPPVDPHVPGPHFETKPVPVQPRTDHPQVQRGQQEVRRQYVPVPPPVPRIPPHIPWR